MKHSLLTEGCQEKLGAEATQSNMTDNSTGYAGSEFQEAGLGTGMQQL